jgi:hypothetical protein
MFYLSRIPDPGVKKAPDPGSRSVTLQKRSEKEKTIGDFRTRKKPEERDEQKGRTWTKNQREMDRVWDRKNRKRNDSHRRNRKRNDSQRRDRKEQQDRNKQTF